MNDFIPYGRQWVDGDDIQAVVNVLRSDWLTQGPKIEEFEKDLANYCGAKYAVAVLNGTAALHLACLAAKIGLGDEVITSSMTFVASANCALYVGAKPILVDIDPETTCLDPVKIEEYLNLKSVSKKTNVKTRPKAIIPVHFAGHPCEMEAIKGIAAKHNLLVIEDACHALGAKWKDRKGKWQKVGSCSHSDMTVFSFHPVKQITTGEGGAILTNNLEFYERLLLLRNHGITKDPSKFVNRQSLPPWYYEIHELGFNYRITDIQCAIGIAQLKRVDEFIKKRRVIASKYNKIFSGIDGITVQNENAQVKSSCHLYVLQIDFESIGKTRTQIMNEFKKKGIGTQVHYIPIHLQPYYQKMFGYKEGDYVFAELYYDRALSIPIYPLMQKHEIDKVVSIISSINN